MSRLTTMITSESSLTRSWRLTAHCASWRATFSAMEPQGHATRSWVRSWWPRTALARTTMKGKATIPEKVYVIGEGLDPTLHHTPIIGPDGSGFAPLTVLDADD